MGGVGTGVGLEKGGGRTKPAFPSSRVREGVIRESEGTAGGRGGGRGVREAKGGAGRREKGGRRRKPGVDGAMAKDWNAYPRPAGRSQLGGYSVGGTSHAANSTRTEVVAEFLDRQNEGLIKG